MEEEREIIFAADVSTQCIGICILLNDGSQYGKIIELTHINPKASKKKVKGIEELFLKKRCFEEFIQKFKDFGITKAVIEEPLLSSNNQNTVATLLRFNGMISESIYNTFGVVPLYISSYDARKYSFPELTSIRKFSKNGTPYENAKILSSIRKNNLVLFGSYPWTIDKKTILQEKVANIFPQIEWVYDKKGNLKKENFDATDSYVACLGQINKERYGEFKPTISNIRQSSQKVNYDVSYWNGLVEHRITYLNSPEVEAELQSAKEKKETT